mgnify:FL=1|tara:strand:+ start:127 stop:501 length:375 start_codon:yes stop_codon:yes gene_type:complete
MNKMNRREKLIWAASFIDGEGYVEYKRIPKKNGRGIVYPTIVIKIEVCNTDFAPIRFLKEIFGGVIYKRKSRITAKGTKTLPQEMWTIYHKKVYEVCKDILPFLMTTQRKDKAKQIINYYENIK